MWRMSRLGGSTYSWNVKLSLDIMPRTHRPISKAEHCAYWARAQQLGAARFTLAEDSNDSEEFDAL
jgi:hypothetical protein